jgi:copper chaperone
MKHTYAVAGMTCGGCATAVERAIKRNDSSLAVEVDFSRGRVIVTGAAAASAIEEAVTGAGFAFEGIVGT